MTPATRLRLAGGLAIAGVIALALRLFFVVTPHGILDADEAVVGLMARHVLQGEFPVFFYGQRYMGGLEPHLAALGFALGGATPLALKLVCLAEALVLVALTAELGRRLLGPGTAVVAGLLALPPVFLTVWTLKARGGFIETLVLGCLALLLAHQTVETTGGRRRRAALVLGLVGGLAWWTCQLVVSYLVVAGLIVVRGAGWRAGLRVLPLITGAFVLGSLPMWLQEWLGQPGAESIGGPVGPETAARQLHDAVTIGLPALLGPAGRWPASPAIEALTPPLFAIYGLAWLALLRARLRAWRGDQDASSATGATLDAILALPVVAVLVCALSPVGWFVSEPRYLLPVAAVIPLLMAALFVTLWRARLSWLAITLAVAVSAVNLAGHVLAPWIAPREAPSSLQAAIAFFKVRRIPVVVTSYWIGPRMAFESAERVVAVSLPGRPVRYPPYVALARRSDRFASAIRCRSRRTSTRCSPSRPRPDLGGWTPGSPRPPAPRSRSGRGSCSRRSSASPFLRRGPGSLPPTTPPAGPSARGDARIRHAIQYVGGRPPGGALPRRRAAGEGERIGRAARLGFHSRRAPGGGFRRLDQAPRLHPGPPGRARGRAPRARVLLVRSSGARRR
ncbi:MAG TPA: hypothetical protein VHO73_07705 [Methylomirabilota bacterium]|nr:hypothetical protein [Methylomirabilota bacterium]